MHPQGRPADAPGASLIAPPEPRLEDLPQPTISHPSKNGGSRPPSRRRRRHGRRNALFAAVLILLLLIGSGGAGAYFEYGQAKHVQDVVVAEFTAAQADLQKAKSTLANSTSDKTGDSINEARTYNASARTHFQNGRRIADTSQVLTTAAGLPYASSYVKPRLKAIDELADMGVALTYTVDDAAAIDEQLVKPSSDTASGGAKMLAVLKAIQPQLDKLKADLTTAKVAVDQVDISVLPKSQQSALTLAKTTIDKGLTGVQTMKELTPIIFEILGGNGPRTYLIEQINPAELRAGGGFFGSYAVLNASGGDLKQTKSGAIETIDYNAQHVRPQVGQKGYVSPPAVMTEFLGTNSWTLEDSNFFPDFPTNAKWAEYFSDKEMQVKPDGVFSIDPVAVGYLMGVTGPITVPGTGITVEGGSFADYVFNYENGPGAPPSRKAFLGEVASLLIAKLATLPPPAWPGLLTALNKAAQEHHMQVSFNNQSVQDQMAKFGWTQTLNPLKAPDFAMDVESNFGGTKANHFLTRRFDVTLAKQGDSLHHKVVVQLDENLNAPVVPDYPQIYRAYCRFYMPDSATNRKVGGVKADDHASDEKEPGVALLDGWIQITPKNKVGSYTVTYEYDTPWHPDDHGSELLFWQKQSGTNPDQLNVTFMDGSKTLKASGTLVTDLLVSVGDSGLTIKPNQTSGASLPSISL
ncbi:MAG TPA: DUF4012 domain-containing protein [Candidatus Dormibacteraeota bacterium]